MKICFFGSSLVSSYWNGAATYYRGMLKEIAALGHDITFYEPDAFERQAHRDIADPPWARVSVYPATAEGWQHALSQAARSADLLIKASGVGVFDRELEIAIAQGPANAIRIYWDVDAPATLDAIAGDPDHHLRDAIPRYDMVLTYGGGDPVVEGYRAVGARLCVPVYNALDASTHYPVPPDPRFAADLGFLGNRLPDRERRVETFFLEAAERLPTRVFLLGGNGWHDKRLAANVQYVGHVYTRDHNAFNCTPRAVLNISRSSMARYGFSPATRVFEAAGAGACIITDAWEGIELFLEPDTEILVAQDGDEVVEHLRRLRPEQARRIGKAAHARVLAQHTYQHRAAQVVQILDGEAAQVTATTMVTLEAGAMKAKA